MNFYKVISIFDDENYKSALKYADSIQRDIYEQEAKMISHIQKGILSISQKEAKNTLDTADVILAKGQGNFETMRMCGKNVYYIFLCKCEMFARQFDVPRFTGILINDREVQRRINQ